MHEQIGNSPFGLISVTSNGNAVTGIRFLQDGETDASKADNVSRETWQQIEQWCAGERQEFDLPLAPPVSASLHEWLTVLGGIPYGHTVTYKEFALRAGKPEAPRAAGTACARNPIPLIIPCHRITKHDGSLGNFGGIQGLDPKHPRNLALKQALIDHEHYHH